MCDMGSGSFGEIMELPKQLLYLRAQLGFMEAREANHAEKTNIHSKCNIQAIQLEIVVLFQI